MACVDAAEHARPRVRSFLRASRVCSCSPERCSGGRARSGISTCSTTRSPRPLAERPPRSHYGEAQPVLPSPSPRVALSTHYGLIGHNLAVPAVGFSPPLPYLPFLRHTHLPPRPPAPSSLASRPTHAYPTARRASNDGTLTGCPAGRALRAHCCAACSRRALPAARASLSSGLRTARSSARRQSCWTCASRRARTRSTSRWRMTGLADRRTARHGRAGEGTRGGDV